MPEVTLLDTGPLVALLDADEEFHRWATNCIRSLRPPLVVCEAVLTEAFFLLKSLPRARLQVRVWVQSGFLQPTTMGPMAILRAFTLMDRFANVPMSFADACLVALAESTPDGRIFTLDRDFLIYRRGDDLPLSVLAPFAN